MYSYIFYFDYIIVVFYSFLFLFYLSLFTPLLTILRYGLAYVLWIEVGVIMTWKICSWQVGGRPTIKSIVMHSLSYSRMVILCIIQPYCHWCSYFTYRKFKHIAWNSIYLSSYHPTNNDALGDNTSWPFLGEWNI